MPRTLACVSLLAGLLAGCAYWQAAPADPCAALFKQLPVATQAYRDAQYHRLPGFSGLRSDRVLAALGASADSPEQRRQWLLYLAERDAEASRIEIAQLPSTARLAWAGAPRQADLSACRTRQVDRLSADPEAFARAVEAAQVPDDYRDWARTLGLYPLFKPILRQGIAAWQQAAALAAAPEDDAHWLGYQPIPLATQPPPLMLHEDSLGLPQAQPQQLDALFARHAPRLKIAQAGRSDRIGSPYYRPDGGRDFNPLQARLYQHSSWSQLNGRWHLQLIYQFWFSQRPKPNVLDLYGGELDGLLWRVTLDRQGKALLYDSIHPCGCWHSFYLPADSPLHLRQNVGEEARLSQRLSVTGDSAPTLWLSAGEHRLQWVDARRSRYPTLLYQRGPLDQLRQLPHSHGQRSLYGKDGLVPGSERLERWLLWPSGVVSPGAMRQWGRHATAFIGRAHFDDPHLLERYFQ
ncbi:hypothetical protein P8H27_03170 [Pseudomonas sp. sp1636]|uniref:hypothetical protein n=1 Tax=Pseudomonas sp. sp1636 TaxID=3036707 RepID=UPI0025A67F42|nr:hypothetical protein [Pseudomonas sp. sp1636]MDM8347897.1 hypothetical protein [Pseudomonas sp. sp1636]